jgi:protein SHQ1
MITPLFEVSQDDKYVVLEIRVPYMKASTFDYYIIGAEFKFFAKPYFLRLTFPHPLDEEGGHERLAYDISNGILTVHLPKATPGQFFENLGMITQLLAKKKPVISTAPVQIVSTGTAPCPVSVLVPWHACIRPHSVQ